MSNLQIIEELCGICTDLAKIVTEQQKLLAQHDAIALAEDIDRVLSRMLLTRATTFNRWERKSQKWIDNRSSLPKTWRSPLACAARS